MNESYLEVTFRHGRPLAAYYSLPRRPKDKSYRTKRVEPGLVIDFRRDGKPIGIEIPAPEKLTLAAFNRVLRDLGFPTLKRAEPGPLDDGIGGSRVCGSLGTEMIAHLWIDTSRES